MVLFVSDMHFGRGSRSSERAKERALLDCLKANGEQIEHLYLLGDVFEGYIEYRHAVPKGFARFQGLLAEWTDRGIPVTYVLGNHDPWHREYFPEELGVNLVADSIEVSHVGRRLYIAHGDALASTHRSYDWLRPLLRHPVPVTLYRSLLPVDVGLALAKWVSHRLYDETPDPAVVQALRTEAQALLQRPDLDAVLLGHSHASEVHTSSNGVYVNTGNWYEARSFARLDDEGLHLLQWNGSRATVIESAPL